MKSLKRLLVSVSVGAVVAAGALVAAQSATAASPPQITPNGKLTHLSPANVKVSGLIPGETYQLSICDGTYTDQFAPNCDLDANFSRTFYAQSTEFEDTFAVRKTYSTRGQPNRTITCRGDTGSVCYMVIYQVGTWADGAATRVNFF